MAVGFPLKTTYANGDVYSASDVNDITGTVNLLTSSTLSRSGGKNAIINGGMDVWQRGTSFSNPTSGTYLADRWKCGTNNGTGSITVSRQSAVGLFESDASSNYFFQTAISLLGTTSYWNITQAIEDVATMAGKTCTISFWAKADASRTMTLYIYQVFGTGGSSTVTVVNGQTFAMTTVWQRFTYSFSMPSISGKTVGTNSQIEVTFAHPAAASTIGLGNVQLELGSTATTFSRAGGTIQGELAACQRYYWRNTPNGSNSYLSTMGTGATTSIADMIVAVPVPMRVVPTVLETSTIRLLDGSNAFSTGTWTLNSSDSSTTYPIVRYTHGSAALTQFRPYFIAANGNSAAYLGLGAEL